MQVRRRTSQLFLLCGSLGWLSTAAFMTAQKAPAKVSFSRQILPILSDKCFRCHGFDPSTRMAGMRLDTPEGAFASRGGRFPIVPGKPQHSLILKRIHDQNSPMPPIDSGKKLTKSDIALLTQWITEGAKYSSIWSFEPLPKVVPVPKPTGAWPRNNVDRFILARLNAAKLRPSKEADKHRLLRRVTYDLTGLPPTEKEIAAFLSDPSPNAYEKVVDRLLTNPHFGERLAVEWLDAARYSDSYGYQSDLLMPAWPFRDWVVRAFNKNQPYDQFLRDQLAGDLLPNPTRDQRLATAFNRLHRQSNEGGSIALEFQTEYAVDRVSTFGTAMLGLTLGCARCHDHKFDPVTQKEFFQLYAYFNSINENGLLLSTEIVPTPSLLLPTPEQEARLKILRKQSLKAENDLFSAKKAVLGKLAQAQASTKLEVPGILASIPFESYTGSKFANSAPGEAFAAKLGEVKGTPGVKGQGVLLDGDNGIVVKGLPGKERWDAFTWSFWIQDPRPNAKPMILLHRSGGTDVGFCGFDLVLENGYLTARVMRHWPGNAIAVRSTLPIPKGKWTQIGWSWDGSGRASGLKLYVNGNRIDTATLADKLWKKINAYGDHGPSGGDWAFGQRFREAGFKGGKLDELTFANRALSGYEMDYLYSGKWPEREWNITAGRYEAHHWDFIDFLSYTDPSVLAAYEALRKAQKELAEFEETVYEISVMEETPKPVPAYLLARGNYDAPRTAATKVSRGVPKALPPLAATPRNNRLALANWLTQPNHPLTARVAVNRFWQMFFGVGLVETSENFGVQGAQPTHPELLDYLARRFVDSRWNVKGLLKEIAMSATYRQDSARTRSGKDPDPMNRLYSRGPSYRLSAEMIRDTALAASGLLNGKIGGAPVNPYQPAGIWSENNTMSPPFVQSKGPDLYRRSIYSTVKRTTPVPSMLLFDATSREACSTRRPATNTPLQALVLLNDVQFVEACRVLAEGLLLENLSNEARLERAFVRLAGRKPDARELDILMRTLEEQREVFKKEPTSAKKLLAIGDSKPNPSLDPVEFAAMTVTVQAVLNSDSVVWKR